MSDDQHDAAGNASDDVADVIGSSATSGRSQIRRHLVVLVVALVGLAIGGALVISGRSSSNGTPSNRTTPGTTATGTLLPSLGIVPDLDAAKALLDRLDPRSLRPIPTATTTTGPATTAPAATSETTIARATTASASSGLEGTHAAIRRCRLPIEQQTTDRSLGDQLAAARLQVGVATDLVISYALPASGNDPAATRVLLVDARSCRVLAAVQH